MRREFPHGTIPQGNTYVQVAWIIVDDSFLAGRWDGTGGECQLLRHDASLLLPAGVLRGDVPTAVRHVYRDEDLLRNGLHGGRTHIL